MIPQTLRDKFFVDPDWKEVEKILMDYINPLIEMSDIDTKQPAEHVKAEIIGRRLAYKQICSFLEQTGLVADTKNYKQSTFK
jgi:hypothetical protein